MTLCYKIMDHLPNVPDEYVHLALTTVNDTIKQHKTITDDYQDQPVSMINTIQERVFVRNGQEIVSRYNPRYTLEPYMNAWVNDNISREWSQIGVATSVVMDQDKNSEMPSHCFHTDVTRSYVLFYLLESSNSDQDTVFWREPGKSLHKKRGTVPRETDHFVELDRICIPKHTWIYFDASILHSVENIQGLRTAIQISFDCDPLGVFVKG